VLRISSDGDDRWNFFRFEIFDSGIFWVGKCGKYFFVYLWGVLGYLKQSEDTFLVVPYLVPRPHYYARPMRFGSRGPRKFLRPRQTRRSETFCLTWGGAFGSGQAVNTFFALMKDVQQPWRVQRNEHFYSMHVFIVESRLAFLFHLSH